MRVLQVVKTADGADWAALQAAELAGRGVEVHVALPSLQGRTVGQWRDAGAILHVCQADIDPRQPWQLPTATRQLRDLVAAVKPDLIHSHFVSSTILLRVALGANAAIPRLFQVPGPLHLEHPFWRHIEIATAGPVDSWIASSRCILGHYQSAGIDARRLYFSYYGTRVDIGSTVGSEALRKRFGIADGAKIIGNANFVYPPKRYLGQRIGLKAHEDVIDALGLVMRERQDVVGVLLGGSFLKSQSYEQRLRERARRVAGDRILMPGYLSAEEIRQMWPDFDIAVHVPTSENCGGVIEPMLAGVPTIAGLVGGLPEVVIDGVTGTLVPIQQPGKLAAAILETLDSYGRCQGMARTAQTLVREMFDVKRTASEVFEIYRHMLHLREQPPAPFNPISYLVGHAEPAESGLHHAQL
jgi:glycosyltransferase involved in cell wall biosynthesis